MPLLNDSDKVFLGGTALDAVYLGGAKVWPSGGTQPPAAPMGYRFTTDMEGWEGYTPTVYWVWDAGGGSGALRCSATSPVDSNRIVGLYGSTKYGDPYGPDTIAELQRIGLVPGRTYRATWTWWLTGDLPAGLLERHFLVSLQVANASLVPSFTLRIEKTGTMPVGVQTTVSDPFVFDPSAHSNTTMWRPTAIFYSNSTGDNDMYVDSLVYEEVSP
jgi:hypothetical protein